MKKYLYLLMAFATLAVFSCKEPEPEPVPAPVDEAYADFIFQYEVNLPADASSYSYVELDLASVKGVDSKGEKYDVWECFGLSSQSELIAALGTLSGGAQTGQTVDFVAFDVSTEYVVENPSTTNAFGHWHMANGDVCSWGDNAYVFAEADFVSNENLVMNIGQYPGRLKEGETYKIIEGMQDDEVSVAFEITINVKPQTEWAVYNITNVEGEPVEYKFDTEAIANLLGVSDLAQAIIDGTVVLKPRNADGSYYGSYSQVDAEDAKGVFHNLDGDCCNWYNEDGDYYGHFYTTIYYGTEDGENYLEFYLTPYAAQNEDVGYYEFSWDLVNGDKVATIIFCTDLEEALTIDIQKTVTVDIEKPYVEDYTYTVIGDDLVDYASLAAELGLNNLLVDGIMFAVNKDGSVAAKGTDNWFGTDGNLGGWGPNASIDVKYEKDTDADHLLIFVMPVEDASTRIGNTYTGAVAVANGEGKAVCIRVNVKITEPAE